MVEQEHDIGSGLIHQGRSFIFRGYSRLSYSDRQYVDLEDAETGEWLTVALDEIESAPADDE